MKKIFYLLILLLALEVNAQEPIFAAQWQEDLRFLQQKIHEEHSMLFHKISEKEFDDKVDDFYAKIPNLKAAEIKVGFSEIIALFAYGHTSLWLTAWRYNPSLDFQRLPYNLYWFADGIYVQGVDQEYKEALGARVLKIGGKSVEEVLSLIKPVVSAENQQFFKSVGAMYLGVPAILYAKGIIDDLNTVNLTLEKDNKIFEVSFKPKAGDGFPGKYFFVKTQGDWLAARPDKETPLWLKELDKKYFYEYLPTTKTVYIRQSEVVNDTEPIAAFYKRVFDFIADNKVEKLIIDLRLNGGGDNRNNKEVIREIIKCEKIDQKGKLYVIIGRQTFSAAQNLVNEIENYTNAIFVGEPTGENVNFYGDTRNVVLPHSGLSVFLSHRWWQDKDSRDKRQWTAPQISVELSFQDYFNNDDPVLEIIEMASPIEVEISKWKKAGDVEEFKRVVNNYYSNPKYAFYNFEKSINAFGYQLVNADDLEKAISLFELNAKLYSNSPNVWDSLAESYWRQGQIEKAKRNYKKVIQLDPNGRIGENARNMLERINEN